MSQLRESLSKIATTFVDDMLRAVRDAPLYSVAQVAQLPDAPSEPERSASGRHSTRTRRVGGSLRAREIDTLLGQLLALLAKYPEGEQGGNLRYELGLSKGQFLRVATAGLATKRLRREGYRRGIKYYLA